MYISTSQSIICRNVYCVTVNILFSQWGVGGIDWKYGLETGRSSDPSILLSAQRPSWNLGWGRVLLHTEICNITADMSVVFVRYGRYIEMLETAVRAEFFS